MHVTIYARETHREWIESEGFSYAASAVEAAVGAEMLSVHVGLGRFDPERGTAANVGFLDATIIESLAPGAMLVNYDRGEIVETAALDAALTSGRIGFAAIDADVFLDDLGRPSGPLVPYLQLAARHPDRVLLLPHAAADTDHPTRVAGAMLAVDMVISLLTQGRAHNLVGDLPAGLGHGGLIAPLGIGSVSPASIRALAGDHAKLAGLAAKARAVAEFYGRLAASDAQAVDAIAGSASAREAISAGNHLLLALRRAGLLGPYRSEAE